MVDRPVPTIGDPTFIADAGIGWAGGTGRAPSPVPGTHAPRSRAPRSRALHPAETLETPWKILVVDDDDDVHRMAALALVDLRFEDRGIARLSARSGAEARLILRDNPDIAVILIAAIMAAGESGLPLVTHVRRTLGNTRTRIILRTPHPDLTPEREVLLAHDINDHRAKPDLTPPRLATTLILAVRSYRDLDALDRERRALEGVMRVSASVADQRSLRAAAQTLVDRVSALLPVRDGAVMCARARPEAGRAAPTMILAASGAFAALAGQPTRAALPRAVCDAIDRALASREDRFTREASLIVLNADAFGPSVVYAPACGPAPDPDRRLVALFAERVARGLDAIFLHEHLRKSEEAMAIALAKLAEFNDPDAADHVRRVADLATRIAVELHAAGAFPGEIDRAFTERIGLASALHDVGKINLADPARRPADAIDASAWVTMRAHAMIGEALLRDAAALVGGGSHLALAAEVAGGHHERYDGTGYPRGLRGGAIPLAARIASVADVFDALITARDYKPAWPLDAALRQIARGRGSQFDPLIVDAFLAVMAREGHGLADDASTPARAGGAPEP